MKPPWPDEHCEKANLLISIRVREPDTGPDDEVTAKKTRMSWMEVRVGETEQNFVERWLNLQ